MALLHSIKRKGQVVGRRWKILHNFMYQSSFADIFVGCGISTHAPEAGTETPDHPLCYLRNDTPDRFAGTVVVLLISVETGKVLSLTKIKVSLGAVEDEGSAQQHSVLMVRDCLVRICQPLASVCYLCHALSVGRLRLDHWQLLPRRAGGLGRPYRCGCATWATSNYWRRHCS